MKIGGKVIAQYPGVRYPVRQLSSGVVVQRVDWRDDPDNDEVWADAMAAKHGGRQSIHWLKNYEGILTRGGEAVWPMLSREIHVRIFPLVELKSTDWTIYRGLDHGMRHPECCAWAAVNRNGDMVLFRQYYRENFTIPMNAKEILAVTPPGETVRLTVADPSIWQRDAQTGEVWADVYAKNGLSLVPADHSRLGYEKVTMGFLATLARWAIFRNNIDLLRDALKCPTITFGDAERMAAQPAIWFTPETANGPRSLYEECANFRWKPVTGDAMTKAPPEDFQDVDDEGPDVVRYLAATSVVKHTKALPVTAESVLTKFLHAGKPEEKGRLDYGDS